MCVCVCGDVCVRARAGARTHACADMPHGTDCPYPIRILAFFEMIRPYHVGIRI